jgi:hypothetical protein
MAFRCFEQLTSMIEARAPIFRSIFCTLGYLRIQHLDLNCDLALSARETSKKAKFAVTIPNTNPNRMESDRQSDLT